MDVAIAVVDGVLATGVSAVIDLLSAAESVRVATAPESTPFTFRCVGTSATATAGNGMIIPCSGGFDQLAAADLVVVPGFSVAAERDVAPFLRREEVRDLVRALREIGSSGIPVAAACAGSFLVAEAGLLDGRRATTTWWLSGLFRARYPAVDLVVEEMVVRDGPVLTAGAAFGHADLALAMVASASTAVARTAGSYLAVDQRTRQGPFIELDHLTAGDPLVADFDRLVTESLAESPSIHDLALGLGTTRRTLERRVKACTGMTPLGLIQFRRARTAEELLATTEWSTTRVALQVGYGSASTLRRLLRQMPPTRP